jgi:hypothetical protein
MKHLHDSVNHLMLALIIGVVSLGVSFMADVSKNMQSIAISVQELNIRIGHVNEIMKDHENRLRKIETKGAR